MFDKNKFAQIIKDIKETYHSQEEFSKKSEIGRTYLSQYMNKKLDEPPKPKILEKLANASHDITTYKELMRICGYVEKTLENKVFSIYKMLKDYHNYINNGKSNEDNSYEIEGFIEDFQKYLYKLYESLTLTSKNPIFFNDIFDFSTAFDDYKYIGGFLLSYNEFLTFLQNEGYIDINNYDFIDCFNINDIYNHLNNLEHLELFSLYSKNITIRNGKKELDEIVKYVDSFSRYLSLSYLAEFDSNSLIELFKRKTQFFTNKTPIPVSELNNESFYMCPVYSHINPNLPDWSKKCIEGRIPINSQLFNLAHPENYFFLKIIRRRYEQNYTKWCLCINT